jgi:N-acetylmuramic acid 6-phosphate etherase
VLDPRVTERRNPRSVEIDLASAIEIVDLMNAEDRTVAEAVATQRTAIARAIELVETAFRAGHRLFYVGATHPSARPRLAATRRWCRESSPEARRP